jgi:alkaline phosphatase
MDSNRLFTRRAFIRQGTVSLAGSAVVANVALRLAEAKAGDDTPHVRIGLVTDLHYADKPPAGTRFYRESLEKFAEATKRFGEEKVDLVVELGDLIDSADSLDVEKDYLRRIAKDFTATPGQYHDVPGNHYCTLKAMVEGAGRRTVATPSWMSCPTTAFESRGIRKQKTEL